MAKPSGFLRRQEETTKAFTRASKETYVQFMTDMYSLSLNDPDVMGNDTLGEQRLAKVNAAVSKNFDLYHEALMNTKEADVVQEKLDTNLKRIYKTLFVPFKVRYDWVIQQTYQKKSHKKK